MHASVQRPADRYGAPRRTLTPRGWAAVVGAVVVVAVVVAAWWAWATRDAVVWRDLAFDVRDATTTQVSFQVTMDPGTVAVCTVRALSEAFAEVGLVDVTVGPSDERTVGAVATVPTSELATTGTVKGCVVRD